MSESVASNLMGQRGGSPAQQAPPTNQPTPGIVTIIDTQVQNSIIFVENSHDLTTVLAALQLVFPEPNMDVKGRQSSLSLSLIYTYKASVA